MKDGKDARRFALARESCSILQSEFADYWCGAALFDSAMWLCVKKGEKTLCVITKQTYSLKKKRGEKMLATVFVLNIKNLSI